MGHLKDPGAGSTPSESLPELLARLVSDVSSLVETKIGLLKVEIKEDLENYARQSLVLGLGWVMAAAGFALLSVALALFISSLFQGAHLDPPVAYALGFTVLALIDLLIGVFLIVRITHRLGLSRLWPERSVKQLDKDKQWIQKL